MLVADYYPRTKAKSAITRLYYIVGGHRSDFITFNVANKAEGRAVAQRYGAKPWNF